MSVRIDGNLLLEILEETPANQNIMLMGKHGIGKSQILEKFYTAKGCKVVSLFLGQMSDPGDLIGIPHKNEETGHTEFMPPYWFPMIQSFVTVEGKNIGARILSAIIIAAVILITIILTVLLNDGVRKIPVHYNGRSNNSRIAAMGNTNNIPLRVNTSGVMPVIFASSLMQFPVIIYSMFGLDPGTGVWSHILKALQSSYWFNRETPAYTLGLLLYVVLVVFFAYFYTASPSTRCSSRTT